VERGVVGAEEGPSNVGNTGRRAGLTQTPSVASDEGDLESAERVGAVDLEKEGLITNETTERRSGGDGLLKRLS
jgi:hypothetical protein